MLKRIIFCSALALWACASFFATASFAQSTLTQRNRIQLEELMAAGQLETALSFLQQSGASEFDVAMFYARSYKITQRFVEAIDLLRDVLNEFPKNIEARRELAHNLFLARRFSAAQFHFNELLTVDDDPEFVEIYNRFLGQIIAQKKFGFSANYSFHPSSNINRGTDVAQSGELTIGEDSRRTSGLGLTGGLNGFYRTSGASGIRSTISLSLSGTKFVNTNEFDTYSASLQFNREHVLSQTTRLSYGPFVRHTWRSDNGDNRSVGFQASLTENVAPRHQLSYSINIQGVDNLFDKRNNSTFIQNTAGWTYFFSQSTSLYTSLNFSKNNNNGGNDGSSYDSYRIGTQLTKRWKGGLVTQFGAGYTSRKYVGFFGIENFGGSMGLAGFRSDVVKDINVAIYHTKVSYRGIAPRLSCSHSRSDSNIAFNINKVSDCMIGITQSF